MIVTSVAFAAMIACVLIYARAPRDSDRRLLAAAGGAAACAIASGACALNHNWFGTVVNAIAAALWFMIWRRDRERRRAIAAIGGKARARLAALAASLKNAARGAKPALRPAPVGMEAR